MNRKSPSAVGLRVGFGRQPRPIISPGRAAANPVRDQYSALYVLPIGNLLNLIDIDLVFSAWEGTVIAPELVLLALQARPARDCGPGYDCLAILLQRQLAPIEPQGVLRMHAIFISPKSLVILASSVRIGGGIHRVLSLFRLEIGGPNLRTGTHEATSDWELGSRAGLTRYREIGRIMPVARTDVNSFPLCVCHAVTQILRADAARGCCTQAARVRMA